ncbi:MAG TPA: sensor domain-containing diguanylate cyclase, partial [Firmicutes bacterium]|nr:sensor domain-containing diguanylate cyclase [Bacillota bacterium]
ETNHRLIANGVVNIADPRERERFFTEVLKANNQEICSFAYGMENGEYYGARRNSKNETEIVRNSRQTGGHLWFLSEWAAVKPAEDYGKFDPRTQDWYKAATKEHRPVFCPIYKRFGENDLAIAAVYPIYNQAGSLEGVLGTQMILSKINHYLWEITEDKGATAYIVEKSSGKMVANSLGKPNFKILASDKIARISIDQIGNRFIIKSYHQYLQNSVANFLAKNSTDRLHIRITEYRKPGLDWLIITVIPERQFIAEISKNIWVSVVLSVLALLIAVLIYLKSTAIILKPIYDLIHTTEKFSRGDFSQRVQIAGNDEVGKLSRAFNKMADQLYALINYLEEKVKERTRELERTNDSLRNSEENIRLLLDSTAEAIVGIDMEGNCTFCNSSCLKMLGYQLQDELIGKKIHHLIHSEDRKGNLISLEGCQIFQALQAGNGAHVLGEVFRRADGTFFPVECFSYPQYREEKLEGCVVTFFDITERQQSEHEIVYLSYHDQLTGLYNRRYFEQELKLLDAPRNYPLTIIFADMNGLKLVNDSLGHGTGDKLIQKVAEVLLKGCRKDDIVARFGGDEFIVLLPQTEPAEAEEIIKRIKNIALDEKVNSIDISISFGYETKYHQEESAQEILKRAEDYMYKNKLFESPSMKGRTIKAILSTMHEKNKMEEAHSQRVSELCKSMGEVLGLFDQDIEELKTVGLIHDIGKVAIGESILTKLGKLTDIEWKEIKRHPEVGYRILSTVNDLSKMAEYVLAHHERWDGGGYPKGLKGEAIPLQSRIITIADAYDAMTNERTYRDLLSKSVAITELQKNAGKQFDPELLKTFIEKVLYKRGDLEPE